MAAKFFFSFFMLLIPCWLVVIAAVKCRKEKGDRFDDVADFFSGWVIFFFSAMLVSAICWIWS